MPQIHHRESAQGSWFDNLCEVELACAGSFASEENRRLREAYALFAKAPSPDLLTGISLPEANQFEMLLHAGAADSAAFALIGAEAGFMLSRGPEGRYLASVILPGHAEEASAGAETAALAIVGALALALQDIAVARGEWNEASVRSVLRLN